MLLVSLVQTAFLIIIWVNISNTTAEPLRRVRDYSGDLWEEYFDEKTQHFYYFNVKTTETSWLLDFSKKTASQLWSDDDGSMHKDVIDEMFPVQKIDSTFEALGVYPDDIDEIHLRKDLAGRLHNQRVHCLFDHLVGVQARVNFPMALKAPVAFHYMFVSDKSRQENVAKERRRIEDKLKENLESAEDWESLGHIWRVYGNVHRAMDCYRRALEINPYEISSFYINIASLLDQMNYVQDALEVLEFMMASFDVFTTDSESSLALGYVMASHLHVRNKNSGNLTLASEMIDAALALHPQFFNSMTALRQEIHYKNHSFGGPPWLFGGSGSWGHLKNPWLILDRAVVACRWCCLDYFLVQVRDIAHQWPLTSLYLRKCFNATPAVFAGILTRFVVFHGSYLPIPVLGVSLPVLIPMSICMHLTLSTEYFLSDSLLLLLLGYLISYESAVDCFLRSLTTIPKPGRKIR